MPTIKITGMRCGHCLASVTKALNEIDGLSDVQVELEKGEATYAYDHGRSANEATSVAPDVIKAAISKIGFEVVE